MRDEFKIAMSTDVNRFIGDEENDDPAGFDPLAMIAMWEEMDALVKQWEKKYGASSNVASTALKEYASSLIIERHQ